MSLSMEFDAKHVRAFLDKISQDRDQQILEIEREAAAECRRLKAQAYEKARRLYLDTVERVRIECRRERERTLSRLRAELRRRRWETLEELQKRALAGVHQRMEEAWRDPDRQWSWCAFWLDAARREAGPAPLRIVLGRGALDSTRERLVRATERDAGAEIEADSAQGPGLTIHWQDYILDGSLDSLNGTITEAILRELATALHSENPAQEEGQ